MPGQNFDLGLQPLFVGIGRRFEMTECPHITLSSLSTMKVYHLQIERMGSRYFSLLLVDPIKKYGKVIAEIF